MLIIASMVEREAQIASERKKIAAVIYNRLKDGVPLGIDATIRYAPNNWSRPLRQSELDDRLALQHAQAQGLPPTPIGNPGLASIRAAAAPANVSFRYYVVQPGTCGKHAFSSTFEKFQADSARYNAGARRRRRQVADDLLTEAALRRARLAGRPQPLAGDDARRGPRALPAPAGRARRLRGHRARARRRRAFAART